MKQAGTDMASNINVESSTTGQLGPEAWGLIREAFAVKTEIETLQVEEIAAGMAGATVVARRPIFPARRRTEPPYYVTASRRAFYERLHGAWVRTTDLSVVGEREPTWYIRSTGDVDGTGTDQEDPVTYEEVMARIGKTKIPAGITVYVQDDINLTELTYFGDNKADGDHWLCFEGPHRRGHGDDRDHHGWDATTNQDGLITGSSSLVPHVGKLLRITGAHEQGAVLARAQHDGFDGAHLSRLNRRGSRSRVASGGRSV